MKLKEFLAAGAAVACMAALISGGAIAQKGGGGGGGGKPPTPTGLTATAGPLRVDLAWNASSGAASYRVYRSLKSGRNYSLIATVTSTTYPDTGVTAFTRYYYTVTAVNSAGESRKSAEASAVPYGAPPPADATVAFTNGFYGYCTVARADGTGQTRIGTMPCASFSYLAWAPNGGPIYFETAAGLGKINPDGSDEQLLIPYSDDKLGVAVTRGDPAPDGAHRLFYARGSGVLWSARLDGTDQRILASPSYGVGYPSASPNGDQVVVAGVALSGGLIVWTLGMVDGVLSVVEEQYLFVDPGSPFYNAWCVNPKFEDVSLFNPFGTKIVFEVWHTWTSDAFIYRVDTMDPGTVEFLGVVPVAVAHPVVDPTGENLFYSAEVGNSVTVFRANRDGSNPVDWSHATSGAWHQGTSFKPGSF